MARLRKVYILNVPVNPASEDNIFIIIHLLTVKITAINFLAKLHEQTREESIEKKKERKRFSH